MRCIYLGNVDFLPVDIQLNKSEFSSLIRLYVLADKLCDLRTANMVIDRFVSYSDKAETIPGPGDVELSYNSTASGSPLRKVLCDYFLHEIRDDDLNTMAKTNELPRDFLQDVVVGYLEIKHTNVGKPKAVGAPFRLTISKMARCRYHQHCSKSVPECTPSQPALVKVVSID